MKIGKAASSPESSAATGTAAPPARAQESVPAGAAPNEEDTAMCKFAPSLGTDRELKIAELRKRYLEGTYYVDTGELSARIIDEHIETRD